MNEYNLDYCPYKILGVEYDTGDSEIKTNFRILIKKHHPDKSVTDTHNEIAQRIIESYNILICPLKRKKYDYENNINNTKINFTSFEDAIEDLFANASPDIFCRIGRMYDNITKSNEVKLCKSLYKSLPEELRFKLNFIKNNDIFTDLNGGLNFILQKYNDINDINEEQVHVPTNVESDPEPDLEPEPELDPKNQTPKYPIILFKEIDEKFDYDLTNINDNIIPINISIDIKDRYDNNTKKIRLKKYSDIIDIPIFCIKESYDIYDFKKKYNTVIRININLRPHNLYIHENNIIYKKNISLYENYFECSYKIPIPNDEFIEVSDKEIFKRKFKIIENSGMPISDYKRGNIIVFYNIKLPEHIDKIYKSIIEVVFPPLN